MSDEIRDIEWLGHFDDALEQARRLQRAIVMKPLGQGIGRQDDW